MKLTKEQVKDIAIRTVKTFIVVAVGALAVNIENFYGITDINSLKEIAYAALISAVSAGLTAVLNIAIKLFDNWIDDRELTAEEISEALGGEYNE